MIIAIDEVGDFQQTSQRYNYMIAALISQRGNNYERKRHQFNTWKNKINPSKFTRNGEVKGTELTEDDLFRFTLDVLLTEPIVRNIQIRIIPAENPQYIVDIFRMVEADTISKMKDHFLGLANTNGELFFKRFLNWFNHRNFQHYFKLVLIPYCISRSLQLAMGVSMFDWATGDDTNLMNMEIKIDGDFINKSGEKKYFNQLLRQSFRRVTEIHPLPIARELVDSNHQFVRNYLLNNGQINLGALFEHKCTFLNSHDHFELQIADILGTIIHRSSNTGTCMNCTGAIEARIGQGNQIKQHLILNRDPELDTRIVFESASI